MVARNTGAATSPAANTTDNRDPQPEQVKAGTNTNPVVTEGDNLAPGATLAENPNNAPGDGTGFHCGICGQPVGAEGQHYNAKNQEVAVPHANVLVVADNWPALQDEQDAEAVRNEQNGDTEPVAEGDKLPRPEMVSPSERDTK